MLMMPACVSSRNKFCLRIRGSGNRSARPCSWSSAAWLSEVIKDANRRPAETSETLFNQSGRPRRREFGCLSAGCSRAYRRRARLLDKADPDRPAGRSAHLRSVQPALLRPPVTSEGALVFLIHPPLAPPSSHRLL